MTRSKHEMTRLHMTGLKRDFSEDESVLKDRAAKKLGVARDAISSCTILKRSLDARHRPTFVYHVEVELEPSNALENLPSGVRLAAEPGSLAARRFNVHKKERVVVIGAGPAGLFCAHRLADAGLEPILLDRGQPVEIRGRDVSGLMHRGELKEDSNICFGEGGAGTWS
ncbi:MAG: FAD-binding protein, partial [Bradymonadaceae bacterium]